MTAPVTATTTHRTAELDYDAIVIGAGVGGIYQIKRLTDLGVNATVLEAAPDLGGTWYFNRYPGARFDSESYTYGYSFSQELLDEWHWKERFSGQPENLRYLNYVADKFNLRQYMQFNRRVEAMRWDEEACAWELDVTEAVDPNGPSLGPAVTLRARIVITGIGLLSIPTFPKIEGMDRFKGRAFHTFHWPAEDLNLADKRVGVIGTGATGIQVIGEIADKVGDLKVFQRRPNWSSPLNNGPISEQEMDEIRARYDEIFANCARSPGGFEHAPDRRGFYTLSKEERIAKWDELYDQPGFGIWLQNFTEIFVDDEANAEFSEYMADRMRRRIDDPAVADKLIPKDHGYGFQRVPMETNYLEAYNRDNVELVDIGEHPIVEMTEDGLRTTAEHYDLDILVYATGFDAVTGAFDRMDITGVDGRKLRDEWSDGPITYIGTLINGYPNLLMLAGPQSSSASSNFPRAIEHGINWCMDMLEYAWERGYERFESTPEADQAWTEHVAEMYKIMLMRKGKGWFTGHNSNIEGRDGDSIRHFVYNGGAPKFHKRIAEIADNDYEGIEFR